MREQLLGYLVGALDEQERELLETQLRQDPQLQTELERLHECLEPLRAGEQEFDPPVGLAGRTCQFVVEQGRNVRAANPAVATGGGNRWSLADMTVAAGIFLAAGLLFFPAIQQSRMTARLAGCQNNLRQLGASLTKYSDLSGGFFPAIPAEGRQAAAGIYAVRLNDDGLLSHPEQLLCPATELAAQREAFHLPTAAELEAADGPALEKYRRRMGGSYGYNLGYVSDQGYQPVKNQHRSTFALMSDAPTLGEGKLGSINHGGGGQNVLYEDGHVRHLTNCVTHGCNDHIFLNDDGQMAAGVHANDAVIAPSAVPPLVRTVKLR